MNAIERSEMQQLTPSKLDSMGPFL
jgi:hypothetical protein